jgi:hypothetical protein
MQKSAKFDELCHKEATAGRQEGQDLHEFKLQKLKSLEIIANTVNELTD